MASSPRDIYHTSCSSLTLFSELNLTPYPDPCTSIKVFCNQGGLPVVPLPVYIPPYHPPPIKPPHPSTNQQITPTDLHVPTLAVTSVTFSPSIPDNPHHPPFPYPKTKASCQPKHPSHTTPLIRSQIQSTLSFSNPSSPLQIKFSSSVSEGGQQSSKKRKTLPEAGDRWGCSVAQRAEPWRPRAMRGRI